MDGCQLAAMFAGFVRFFSLNTGAWNRSVFVSEIGLGLSKEYCIPDQLVSVDEHGFFWAELQNHGQTELSLGAGDVVVGVSLDFQGKRESDGG